MMTLTKIIHVKQLGRTTTITCLIVKYFVAALSISVAVEYCCRHNIYYQYTTDTIIRHTCLVCYSTTDLIRGNLQLSHFEDLYEAATATNTEGYYVVADTNRNCDTGDNLIDMGLGQAIRTICSKDISIGQRGGGNDSSALLLEMKLEVVMERFILLTRSFSHQVLPLVGILV